MAETQPTDPRPSDTPTERTSLLGSSNAGAAQPVAPVTRQSRLGLPKYLLFPVLIFLLGSGVDYYDGSIFSTGFGSIGALYKQQNHAAWLTLSTLPFSPLPNLCIRLRPGVSIGRSFCRLPSLSLRWANG
jgi:hypothetical protein